MPIQMTGTKEEGKEERRKREPRRKTKKND